MIYLASYTGTHSGIAGAFNRGIRWLTRSPFSHSEVCIGNPLEGEVDCLSSSGVDGGVRIKRMKLSPAKWEVLPMPWVTEDHVRSFLKRNSGQRYDWMGCVRFVFPFVRYQGPARWFCSECVASVAGFEDPWRFSPGDLHVIVLAMQRKNSLSFL